MNEDVFAYLDGSPPGGACVGPLAGTRVAIQPNLSVRGWPTEAGSAALERYAAMEDAGAVERLRAAGARIVGSTRMGELGFGLVGDTTAAALSGGACDAAVLTDTLGEARCAAATIGAVAVKPSYGIVSRHGLIGLVPSMECLAVVARTVEQASAVAAALAGPDERDFSMLTEGIPDFSRAAAGADGPRAIGVIRECLAGLEAAEAGALQAALCGIDEDGVEVREVSLPDFDLFRTVHQVVGSAEASSSGGKYDSVRYGHRAAGTDNWNEMYIRSRAESFGTLVKAYLFQGAYFQFRNYAAFEDACRVRRRLVAQTQALFEDVDALVLPTRRAGCDAAAATTVGEVYDAFAMTLPANVAGMPAVGLPGFVRCGGADLGLQIVGPHLGDVGLLRLAARLVGAAKGGR